MPRLVLRGPRLRLRPWQESDMTSTLEWLNDPAALRAEGRRRPWTEDEARSVSRSISSRGWDFTAFHGRSAVGEFVLALNGLEPNTGRIDLVVGPRFRRRGYGREGIAVCALFAFETLKLGAIYAPIDHGNEASIALHRSLGYRNSRRVEDKHALMFVLSNTHATRKRLRKLLQ